MAKVGGPTPEKSLATDKGMIDVGKLKRNPEFKAMIELGWEWTIVPAAVDEKFPLFAKVAQKAINTANHVGIKMGELETQITLSDLIGDPGFTKHPEWKQVAVSFVEDLCVPCADYATHLLNFVILYGGVQELFTFGSWTL